VTPDILLHVISRFIHISSVVILIGGLFYARQVLTPVLNALPDDLRSEAAAETQQRFRSPLFALLALIVGSGLYNFLTGPHHGVEYQAWFGIKMLLVAHITVAAILWATSPHGDVTTTGKPKRRLLSLVISGLVVIAISSYLRSLTLRSL
jgi:uncharacterized membrane protein